MSIDNYKATDTYVVFAEDTAWGTPGNPAGTDFIDKVTAISTTVKNNRTRDNAIGEGPNAKTTTNGVVEISGVITSMLTNAAFFQYLVNGVVVANTGAQGDPSDVNEANAFGYGAADCPSLTIEYGNDGTVDDVITLDGVFFTNWNLSVKIPGPVVWTGTYRARNITRTASGALTYTPTTEEPLTFVDAAVTFGSDTVVRVASFDVTGANNHKIDPELGGRLISQPTMGTRRYNWTMVVKHTADTTGSKLSGVELRELLFGAAASATPETGGIPTPCGDITLTLTEGAVAGDETIKVQFDDCYIEEIDQPIEMSDTGGSIFLTVRGYALSGLTNGANKTIVEYYTYA